MYVLERTELTQWLRSPYFEIRKLALSGRIKIRWDDWMGRPPAPVPSGVPLAEKVEGMMLGLAIGDALGNTSESSNPADRRARYGWIEGYLPNSHAGGRCVGLPSDDTQLAFRTLEHLIEGEGQHLDPQALGNRLAHGRIFGIGQATRQWLARFTQGGPWEASGTPSAGNGALMRIAPVLIPHLASPNCDLWVDTLMAAHLTHDDELSNVSCIALVDALWRAIGTTGGVEPGWWLDRWLEVCDALGTGARCRPRSGRPNAFDGTISQLLREHVSPALDRQLPVELAGEIWHSGAYLLETVPTVLYVLERFGHDPREAILQAVNQTRDNDTIAAIVGAAVGALHGVSALPFEWISELSGRLQADDDHRAFHLLARAGQVFEYGSTPAVLDRASHYRKRANTVVATEDIPRDLLSGELWVKVVGFLQQNWAVVRPSGAGEQVRVWFVDDGFNVFDFIDFGAAASARKALRVNGFEPYGVETHRWVDSPIPASVDSHRPRQLDWSARRIYSSGRYWVQPDGH